MRDELTSDDRHDADLKAVLRPVDEAHGIPNRCYTDTDAFQEERDRVFSPSWAAITFAHEVTETGMAYPITFMGLPLLVVRSSQSEIKVYQNVCRHRGMILVEKPTKVGNVINCPYHGWCYGLDGRLRGTPHVGGPGENSHPVITRPDLGLIPVRHHVFMGVVYVNIDGTAPDFNIAHCALLSRWRDFVDRDIHYSGPDSSFTLDLETNWKLAVENYCESYHLPWIHPSLNEYSRLEDHYNIIEDMAHSGQGTLVYSPRLSDDGMAFANFDGLPGKWDKSAEYIALYPNALLGVHRDHVYTIIIEPFGPGRCREHISLFYAKEESCGDDFAEMRARNTAQWKMIFEEDIIVVEGMQKGRSAPDFDGGRFSPPMDCATHAFHAWVADRLLERRG